ncbi:SDR family oxidoreductase [Streptomyces broussonetiae]|uniref:SDR family NAD(P)-dependent oxidoreductase n=1 Tax=Streptomyces broussonetiae TaxID=2686304 RepID=A0A6I6NDH5_9ACTN|nr:SDR family oxidoreductase [Streptomyces broussonetiae]QHA06975.1 SDR family NAD(P)-dependent oxidoreductase [Streptomyces broussonetiae]
MGSLNTSTPVVVSGVSRGLGAALARRFAELGHPVAGCGRDRAALDLLRADLGAGHLITVADVTDADAVQTWAEQTVRQLGAPALVVANAGYISPQTPVWETSPADFRTTVDVNVVGVYTLARAFLPRIAAGGTFVAVSSGWGRNPRGRLAAYTASKFAVEGFTKAIAQEAEELLPGVTAVAVDPGGGVDTDMLATCLPDEHTEYPGPQEWARVAADYLLNDVPKEPNGASLTVPSPWA